MKLVVDIKSSIPIKSAKLKMKLAHVVLLFQK